MLNFTMSEMIEQGRKLANGVVEVEPKAVSQAVSKAMNREGLIILDVREASEFVSPPGHIPSAVLLPLGSLSLDTLKNKVPHVQQDSEIVCVCRSGGRSGRAAQILVEHGFKNVMNMSGGMLAYSEAGLATELNNVT